MKAAVVWPRPTIICALVAAAGALLQAQQPVPDHVKGLPNFHQVNEHIYRGGQPSADGLAALRTMGVKTVLDLRPPAERGARENNLLEGWGLKYINIPMPALGAPTLESVQQALSVLNSDKAWPVFIHCQRGADRTGTVIACYRILTQGWTNAQAMKEAESLGLASFQTGKKHFILGWNPPPPGRSLDAAIPIVPATIGPASSH